MSEAPLSERVTNALLESECGCEKCRAFAHELGAAVAVLEQERGELLAMKDMLAVATEKGLAQLRELAQLRDAVREIEWLAEPADLTVTPRSRLSVIRDICRAVDDGRDFRALATEQEKPK